MNTFKDVQKIKQSNMLGVFCCDRSPKSMFSETAIKAASTAVLF